MPPGPPLRDPPKVPSFIPSQRLPPRRLQQAYRYNQNAHGSLVPCLLLCNTRPATIQYSKRKSLPTYAKPKPFDCLVYPIYYPGRQSRLPAHLRKTCSLPSDAIVQKEGSPKGPSVSAVHTGSAATPKEQKPPNDGKYLSGSLCPPRAKRSTEERGNGGGMVCLLVVMGVV